jgi:hypothetical protein
LELVVILVRTNALARMIVPAKTPVLVLIVAHRKFVVSKTRMTDFPVMNPWAPIFSVPVTGLSTW